MADYHDPADEAMDSGEIWWKAPSPSPEEIEPRATGVRFDEAAGVVMVTLRTGAVLGFAPAMFPRLNGASALALRNVSVVSEGRALVWPSLGEELHVPAMVLAVCGSAFWRDHLLNAEWEALKNTPSDMAADLGRKGGASRSAIKAAAVRANGKKGGRPRKKLAGTGPIVAPSDSVP